MPVNTGNQFLHVNSIQWKVVKMAYICHFYNQRKGSGLDTVITHTIIQQEVPQLLDYGSLKNQVTDLGAS